MKEIENKRIWKILEPKECERNWKPKNKEKKLETEEYERN
jgi:hypothetical protein